jgi:hypothetical protein
MPKKQLSKPPLHIRSGQSRCCFVSSTYNNKDESSDVVDAIEWNLVLLREYTRLLDAADDAQNRLEDLNNNKKQADDSMRALEAKLFLLRLGSVLHHYNNADDR